MTEAPKSDLQILLNELGREAHQYFLQTLREVKANGEDKEGWNFRREPDFYWSQIQEETRQLARSLIDKALRYSSQLSAAARNAPLAGAEDIADVREATKFIRGALRLRQYTFYDIEILNDEDRILGVRQPSQNENEGLYPSDAQMVFNDNISKLNQVLKLVEASNDLQPALASPGPEQSAARYRPNTAFIMMWMDPEKSGLTDVVDAVKAVFRSFGLTASRADDIEHEGQITERVLNELRTSEFLFADLTGARPNVYYEVGFAHGHLE